jgi:hypothetical protein
MFLSLILLFSSIAISSVSSFCSITGLTNIFPGAFYTVILMGIVLEIGKLSAVSFLHVYWKKVSFIRVYLSSIVLILMLINAMGMFGYLSNAHIEKEISNLSKTQTIELVHNKIKIEQDNIKDIDKQTSLIDNALDKLTQTGRAATTLTQIKAQQKTKNDLQQSKIKHQDILTQLNQQELEQSLNNKKIESDLGPLKYVANFFSTTDYNNVLTWFILIIIFVFDPLALILLNCSLYILDNLKEEKQYKFIPSTEIKNEDVIKN